MGREKKFTKGPWKAHNYDVDLCCVEQDNDDPLQICGMVAKESCASEDYISPEERKANANLISAAPDLLTSMELLFYALGAPLDEEDIFPISEKLRPAYASALSAIKKAYGEQP